jgi:hypothetical protein
MLSEIFLLNTTLYKEWFLGFYRIVAEVSGMGYDAMSLGTLYGCLNWLR